MTHSQLSSLFLLQERLEALQQHFESVQAKRQQEQQADDLGPPGNQDTTISPEVRILEREDSDQGYQQQQHKATDSEAAASHDEL